MEFFNDAPFDAISPSVDGTCNFALRAFDGSATVASTRMQVIVGAGAPTVAEPGTLAMLGFGCAALGVAALRRAHWKRRWRPS